jgi:hypothetical protein
MAVATQPIRVIGAHTLLGRAKSLCVVCQLQVELHVGVRAVRELAR